MAITFEDIRKANEGLGTVDVKGKDYVVVPQRVKAFRMLYPEGFIVTDILSNEGGVVIMQAKAGYYDQAGNPITLGTGLAFEKQDSSYINKTSFIENCETSAIGRALGFLGLGIDAAICSAEELINAMNNQNRNEGGQAFSRPQQTQRAAAATTGSTVPPTQNRAAQTAPQAPQQAAQQKPETPAAFIARSIRQMQQDFGPDFDFLGARAALIEIGKIPDKPSAQITTIEEAKQMIDAFYESYGKKAG